jgi:hypothetical protein
VLAQDAHGVDLSPRLERVEPEDHDSEHGAGIAVAGLFAASLTAAHVRLAIGLIAGASCCGTWLGARFDACRRRPAC